MERPSHDASMAAAAAAASSSQAAETDAIDNAAAADESARRAVAAERGSERPHRSRSAESLVGLLGANLRIVSHDLDLLAGTLLGCSVQRFNLLRNTIGMTAQC